MSTCFIKTIEDTWINAAFIELIYIKPYYINSLNEIPTKYQVFAQVSDKDFLLDEDKFKEDAQKYVRDFLEYIKKPST